MKASPQLWVTSGAWLPQATGRVIKIPFPKRLSLSIKAAENGWKELSCSSKALSLIFYKVKECCPRPEFIFRVPSNSLEMSHSLSQPPKNASDPHTFSDGCKLTTLPPTTVFYYYHYYDHYYLFHASPWFNWLEEEKRVLLY
ncbi:hypothetical protein AVEN_48832-1 [Araneus ventricosus]|uniref:Uncharacterized protein n=1 Tax=Araneus ventricosus TaxID=182803 RepID=A0A4Y2AHS8_ARAVE|nr:hypothetical protein AVEN_48832-1 [Araneus ventricosus]